MAMTMAALAADPDRERERLARRVERRADRTESAESRWVDACDGAEQDPDDPHARRCQLRREQDLVNRRARWSLAKHRLDALGSPEAEVRVFYATNREDWPRHGKWYRARDAGRVEYGVATVRVPPDHPEGALEGRLDVVSVEVLDPDAFQAELSAATTDRAVLAYVHGYNNSFVYAARRSAQVAHDLDTDVVPVLFSWPSHGGTQLASAKYTFDENAAARSSTALAEALDLVQRSTDAPVSLLAHSMGTRVVADALLDRAVHGRAEPLDALVLAAPDLDTSVFLRRYLDPALAGSDRVTVYCAEDDRALKLSRRVHGGYDRLGSCRGPGLSAMDGAGVEVVDASRLYVDLLAHDKVASSPRLLGDLGWVVRGVQASDPRRGLTPRAGLYELPP